MLSSFFLTCDLFCKNLWFFFQNLMKNFNSCMKHKLQFQPRCPWVVRNDCVQWRNWGNFNDNTNVQGFCDPGIESNYSCGVKIEMTEFMSRFLSGKLEIKKKKKNTHTLGLGMRATTIYWPWEKSLEDVWEVREIVQGKDGWYFQRRKNRNGGKKGGRESSHKNLIKFFSSFWGHKRPQSAPHMLLQ